MSETIPLACVDRCEGVSGYLGSSSSVPNFREITSHVQVSFEAVTIDRDAVVNADCPLYLYLSHS